MTDPFDRFERQVRDAMKAEAPPARRRWRPVRGPALSLAGVLVVSSGALAATRIAGRAEPRDAGSQDRPARSSGDAEHGGMPPRPHLRRHF